MEILSVDINDNEIMIEFSGEFSSEYMNEYISDRYKKSIKVDNILDYIDPRISYNKNGLVRAKIDRSDCCDNFSEFFKLMQLIGGKK